MRDVRTRTDGLMCDGVLRQKKVVDTSVPWLDGVKSPQIHVWLVIEGCIRRRGTLLIPL